MKNETKVAFRIIFKYSNQIKRKLKGPIKLKAAI